MIPSEEDLEVRFWTKSPNYDAFSTGVVFHHRPTGIIVGRCSEKSKMSNKILALHDLTLLLDQYAET